MSLISLFFPTQQWVLFEVQSTVLMLQTTKHFDVH